MKRYTPLGAEYYAWEKPLPRIPDYIADCSIYLYPSADAAKRGTLAGGSGFLVHVQSTVPGYGHLYAVTNDHVITEGNCGVIRFNRRSGGVDTISTHYGDWIRHPDRNNDVAVYPIKIEDAFKWFSIDTKYFIDRLAIDVHNIGYGDEVFLVGRLITHSGHQRNAVVIRFGNISLMADPNELIECENHKQEGFLVECRSLSGSSGSPVFVTTSQDYRGEQQLRVEQYHREKNPPRPGDLSPSMYTTFGPWLLGIDWGHMPLWTKVCEKNDLKGDTGLRTNLNTGIACVLPAWKILELLETTELVKDRKKEDERIAKRMNAESVSVNDLAAEEKPFTKEDFEAALKRVSKRIQPSQSGEEK
ncbi:MAG: trypsin-like peptidase domain-containing protein [Candidatus Saccharimonadales bacterium]